MRPTKNIASNESAHAHIARADAIHSENHHGHGNELRDERGERDRSRAVLSRLIGRLRGDSGHGFPQTLHATFGHAPFHGFQTVDHFHKQRVFLHAVTVAFFRASTGGHLKPYPHAEKHGHGQQRQKHQRPADKGHQKKKQNKKRNVDAREQRGGAEKLPQRFKFPQVIDQRARGLGLGVHAHGKHLVHKHA